MSKNLRKKNTLRKRRTQRVRKSIQGTLSRPRLSVVKTNKHIYAQLIDDENGRTMGAVTTCSKKSKEAGCGKRNKESAKKLGKSIAKLAKDNNVSEVIFDRGCFKYHGVLAELANAAREAGLKF